LSLSVNPSPHILHGERPILAFVEIKRIEQPLRLFVPISASKKNANRRYRSKPGLTLVIGIKNPNRRIIGHLNPRVVSFKFQIGQKFLIALDNLSHSCSPLTELGSADLKRITLPLNQ
jgi:hypothetical protein